MNKIYLIEESLEIKNLDEFNSFCIENNIKASEIEKYIYIWIDNCFYLLNSIEYKNKKAKNLIQIIYNNKEYKNKELLKELNDIDDLDSNFLLSFTYLFLYTHALHYNSAFKSIMSAFFHARIFFRNTAIVDDKITRELDRLYV